MSKDKSRDKEDYPPLHTMDAVQLIKEEIMTHSTKQGSLRRQILKSLTYIRYLNISTLKNQKNNF